MSGQEITRVTRDGGLGQNMPGQYHSMHELYDLAQALAYQVGQMNLALNCAAYNGVASGACSTQNIPHCWAGYYDGQQWIANQNVDVQTWLDNFNNAKTAFYVQLDRANAAFKTFVSWAAWDVAPATDSQGNIFDDLVGSFQPFHDLDRRLREKGNPLGYPQDCLPVYPNVPQPSAPDFSLDIYKLASAGQKAVEDVGQKVKNLFSSDGVMLLSTAIIGVALAVVAVETVPLIERLIPERKRAA